MGKSDPPEFSSYKSRSAQDISLTHLIREFKILLYLTNKKRHVTTPYKKIKFYINTL